jgi:chromate transporter
MTLFVVSTNFVNPQIFKFIGPMAIGFVVMAALQMTKLLQKNTKTIALAIISATAAVFFHSPFLFPIVLILGGVISSYWDRAEQATAQKVGFTIRWANLTLMFLILITVAVVGLYTKTTMPHWSQPIRLFENTYRMGIMVFGGGNVLYTMILTEFVEFKAKHYLTIQEFNTGIGLLQAVPGPTFSIATYANGMAMKNLGYGIAGQILGCGVGTIAIFLPGTLLIFFVFPIWNRIKQIPVIYRSLKGIIAVSIGLVWAAAILMIIPYLKNQWLTNADQWLSFAVFILTILYLKWIKQPAVFLVLAVVLAGYLMLLMNA